MARIKIKNIKEVEKRLGRSVKVQILKLLRSKELQQSIGKIAAKDIKKNANFGSPARSTRKWRERYDQTNKTDKTYSRGKLSAVFTGELIDDLIKGVKSNTTKKQFSIEHTDGRHKKYQGKTKKIGSRSKYKEISKGLIDDLGYNYLELSKKAQEEITKVVREELFKLLSRLDR